MATATARQTVKFDEAEGTWDVFDEAGELMDSCDTKAEAVRTAKRMDREAQAEADEEEASDLRYKLADRLEELDLATLRRLAAELGA
jgi:hypothetical protein